MRNNKWRAGLVVIVTLISFLVQSLAIVRPNEVVLLAYRTLPWDAYVAGYIAEPGIYLADPFAEQVKLKAGIKWPSTYDYLNAAVAADAFRDAWLEEEGACNPPNQEGILQMVEDVTAYINRYEKAIGRPVTVDEVVFFYPDKSSGRYDEPVAYYSYLDRHIAFNMSFYREYLRRDDESFLQIVVHELSHSALNFGTGEILCQLLTLQVLWDMAEDDYPGAHFAFWDELRSWFICAAKFRIHYNHGWRALNIGQSREIGYLLRAWRFIDEIVTPHTWATYDFDYYIPSTRKAIWSLITGHPYLMDFENLDDTLGVALMKKTVTLAYNIRVNGIRFYPGRILKRLGFGYETIRLLLGPNYWHREIVLKYGEKDYLKVIEGQIYKGEFRHLHALEEKLRVDPEHFSPIWWEYLYGPLQVIEMHRAGMPCQYITYPMDINHVLEGGDFLIFLVLFFGLGAQISEMDFEDVGPVVHSLLNLKLTPQVKYCPKCDHEVIVPLKADWPSEPPIRPFPLLPLVAMLFVVVDAKMQGRRWWRTVLGFIWHYTANTLMAMGQLLNTLLGGIPATIISRIYREKR